MILWDIVGPSLFLQPEEFQEFDGPILAGFVFERIGQMTNALVQFVAISHSLGFVAGPFLNDIDGQVQRYCNGVHHFESDGFLLQVQ